MNIALFGYGKMGKAIEKVALERGHNIVLKISSNSKNISLKNIDIAIDFSLPNVAFNNIKFCLEQGIPIISGTTGWLDKYNETIKICKDNNGTFLYASNFSIGVNLFFELNKKLAKIIRNYKEKYTPSIKEIHHTQKLDAPSGTAISLAQPILENFNIKEWSLNVTDNKEKLRIDAERTKNVSGTHIVKYTSEIDEIEIKHIAKSRKGFALGAVIASEFIHNKKGVFTMKDVLANQITK